MAVQRYAGQAMGALFKGLGRQAVRYGAGEDAGGVALRLAPDLFMGFVSPLLAPQGFTRNVGEKIGYGAEQAFIGALPGMIAGGLAGTLARRVFKASPQAARSVANTADFVGSFTVPTLAYATNTAPYSRYLNDRFQKEAELQAEQDRNSAFEAGLQAAAGNLAQSPYGQGADRLIEQFYG